MLIRTTALTGAALLAAAGAQAAPMDATAYTLSDGGASLVVTPRLDLPGAARERTLSLDGAALTLDSLAVRPNGRRLYGYSEAEGAVYEIDPDTGEASFAAALPEPSGAEANGFDFNNQVDAARLVTGADENFVFFPDDRAVGEPAPASVERFTDLFYVEGDVNEGADPLAIGNAYTNAVFPPPAEVVQYLLDSETDDLAILGNNAGTLETVGGTGLDFDVAGGFDILSLSEGSNEAFALLSVEGEQAIYGIDLGTGMASPAVGAPTQFGELDGFAVAPVPVPAALPLLAAGLGGLALFGRRRTRRG
jgi:hypothetical protein